MDQITSLLEAQHLFVTDYGKAIPVTSVQVCLFFVGGKRKKKDYEDA